MQDVRTVHGVVCWLWDSKLLTLSALAKAVCGGSCALVALCLTGL